MRAELQPARRLLTRRPVRISLEVAAVLMIVLFAGLALGTMLGDLQTGELRFAPGWFLVAAAGFVALQLMHCALWRHQLRRLGSDLPPRRSRAIWSASALARYVPTSLLMPTVRIAMCERIGVPKRRCIASLVYEAALALAGAIFVAGYFVIHLPQLEDHAARWLAIVAGIAAVVALHPRIFGPISSAALRRVSREPLPMLLPERTLVALWLGYALSFLFAGLALFALARALYPVSYDQLPQVAGAFAVGFSVSVLAFVLPGGLGAREAGIAAALAPAMPAVAAIAVAILVRVLQIVIELALGGITSVLSRREMELGSAMEQTTSLQRPTESSPEPERAHR